MYVKKYRLIYYGFAFVHHKDTKGGYHNIKKFVSYSKAFDLQYQKNFFDIILEKNILFKIFKKAYFLIFKQIGLLELITCSLILIFKKNCIIHFIYPENTYSWLHKIKNKTNKIVCTFHQPPSFYLNSSKWMDVIKHVDGIIVLNKKDLSFFQNISISKKVQFIPHGINTNFFKYDYKINKDLSVLMVGNWLRNFTLAREVFINLNKILPELKINIVVSKINQKYFQDLQVNLYNSISDNDIRLLYQKSSVVFFPLIDFTANNAILEALSCGSKIIISTDKEIDDSYLKSEYFNVINNDVNKICDEIRNIVYTNNSIKENCEEIHNYSVENFSWQVIGNKTEEFLYNL